MKPLTLGRRARGEPLRRSRQLRTRRRWTWRSLLHPPIPQLVVLAIVLAGLYALATSRVFAISTVQVSGDQNLPAELLRDDCRCLGSNIFLANPQDINRRLAAIPYLQIRQVYARLPDRIVINAAYRQPVALWRTAVATYTVAADATVLYDVGIPPVPLSRVPTTATVPIIYSPGDAILTIGQKLRGQEPTALQMAQQIRMELATSASLKDIAPRGKEVDRFRWELSPGDLGLVAHNTQGFWFDLGTNAGSDLSTRLVALAAIMTQNIIGQNHCNFVDLQPLPRPECWRSWGWHAPWGPGS